LQSIAALRKQDLSDLGAVLQSTKIQTWGGAYLPGSELGGLLDISPTSVDPRITFVEAYGLDEDDWLDFLRVRPNKGIRVIFFFVDPALSLSGVCIDIGVSVSCSALCGAEETLRKSFEMSEAMVRGRGF
jgi:hypothetical protein